MSSHAAYRNAANYATDTNELLQHLLTATLSHDPKYCFLRRVDLCVIKRRTQACDDGFLSILAFFAALDGGYIDGGRFRRFH